MINDRDKGQSEAMRSTQTAIHCFESLGLQINLKKSVIQPTQLFEFISAYLDSQTVRVSLPLDRFSAIQKIISTVRHSPQIMVHECLQFLTVNVHAAVWPKYACLHVRCLQGWLVTVYRPNKHTMSIQLTMPHKVRDSLDWWTHPCNLCSGIPFTQDPLSQMITTNASLIRWEAQMQRQTAQGLWSTTKTKPTYKPSRTPCRPQCLPPLPAFHEESTHKGHDQQHRLHVPYKQARGSQITFALH